MTRTLVGLTVGYILLAAMATAQPPASAKATVSGTVTYRERVALPPDAEMLVRLEDTSRPDAPSEVMAEGIATIPHQVPISFELPYDPGAIDPAHRYQVRVTILHRGKSLFITDTAHYVLTRGAPAKVDIVLRQLNPPPTSKGN